MKKILFLVITAILLFSSSSAYASSGDFHSNGKPHEETINGVLYLDGIPLYTEEDIQRMDKEQQKKSGVKITKNRDLVSFSSEPMDTWFQIGTSEYYSGHDWDRMEFHSSQPPASYVLTSKSTTTTKITGSTNFGFQAVAELSMSVEVGHTWEKTYSVTINPLPWYAYEIKVANRFKQRDYKYIDDGFFYDTTYYASSHDKYGSQTWYWANPL